MNVTVTRTTSRLRSIFRRNLSVERRRCWRTVFEKYDKNNDGFISIQELDELIRNQDYEQEIPDHVIEKIHTLADQDHDGNLNYKEFEAMITHPALRPLFGNIVNKYVSMMVPQANTRYKGQYDDQLKCCPPPIAMIIISIVEILFYLLDETSENVSKNQLGVVANVLVYDPKKRFEVWRYFTYMFVHIGVIHLVVNLIIQILVGTPLEMVHRWWRILIIYCAGVSAGSLGTSILDPKASLAGASGGVYALATAHISSIILNWKEMEFPGVYLILYLIIIGCDLGYSLHNRYVLNINQHIGYIAHFTGALAGLLVSINVVRNVNVTCLDKIIWWVSTVTYIVLISTAIVWNLAFPGYFQST